MDDAVPGPLDHQGFLDLLGATWFRLDPTGQLSVLHGAAFLRTDWLVLVFQQRTQERPAREGRPLGHVLHLPRFARGFTPRLTWEELAQEIIQSMVLEPTGPGQRVTQGPLAAAGSKFPGFTWLGEVEEFLGITR